MTASVSLTVMQGWNLKKAELSLSTAWRHTGGVEVQLHSFLTSALDGGEWTTTRPDRCIPGGRNPVPTEQEAGRDEVWARAGVDVAVGGNESRTFQPVALGTIPSTVCPYGVGHRVSHNMVTKKKFASHSAKEHRIRHSQGVLHIKQTKWVWNSERRPLETIILKRNYYYYYCHTQSFVMELK